MNWRNDWSQRADAKIECVVFLLALVTVRNLQLSYSSHPSGLPPALSVFPPVCLHSPFRQPVQWSREGSGGEEAEGTLSKASSLLSAPSSLQQALGYFCFILTPLGEQFPNLPSCYCPSPKPVTHCSPHNPQPPQCQSPLSPLTTPPFSN